MALNSDKKEKKRNQQGPARTYTGTKKHFLSFVIYKASAFRQLFSICAPFSTASVCEHSESYSCSFLISLCGWLFCSLLCVGLCTFRCTASLLSPRTSIDSCSVSLPYFFYSLPLWHLFSPLGAFLALPLCACLPSCSRLSPSASASCLGALSSTPPPSLGTAASPAPAAPGTCWSGLTEAGQNYFYIPFTSWLNSILPVP